MVRTTQIKIVITEGPEREESGRLAEPLIMHRTDKIGVSDGKPGRRANNRVSAARGAEGGPALVLNPVLYITDYKRLYTKEAAANLATLQFL